jgi:hypothetical protein
MTSRSIVAPTFLHTVGLVTQPDDEFHRTVMRLTIGDAWLERVPRGVRSAWSPGDPTADGIAADVAAGRLAIYDPAVDRIYMPESRTPRSPRPISDSRSRTPTTPSWDKSRSRPRRRSSIAGISSTDVLAQRSVDRLPRRRDACRAPNRSCRQATKLPLPIAYELLATDALGEAVLLAAGADPATSRRSRPTSRACCPRCSSTGRSLRRRRRSRSANVRSASRPRSAPTTGRSSGAPGLPPSPSISSFRWSSPTPTRRSTAAGPRACPAVFEAGNPDQAGVLLVAMTTWVAGAPMGSASVTALSETRVQLIACDPGADAAVNAPIEAAAALVDRQLVRLAG